MSIGTELFKPSEEQARNILGLMMKLSGLGIKDAKFTRIEPGPVVTSYYFTLSNATPISKILNKEEDIALACKAETCIISRIGGEICIAIPNETREIVSFDRCLFEIASNPKFASIKLPLMLGVDTKGNPAVLDLMEAPHVLIAGQTGGGKSVLLSSFISGLVTKCSPQELKLILVDTKMLDLPLFSELPHVCDNCTTVEAFHDTMNRLMAIVRQRTEKMKGMARNITEYNALGLEKKLPYYVMLIDELADLIDGDKQLHDDKTYPYCDYPKVQPRLKSLLQICRAAGVFVICATQRTSTKVINGDIKANLPTRIALRLPSRYDSATILSGGGAEHLLGKGDMLVESTDSSAPVRYHGAYVSMDHVANIISQHEMIRGTFALMAKGEI